jgi:hypothetical protein
MSYQTGFSMRLIEDDMGKFFKSFGEKKLAKKLA